MWVDDTAQVIHGKTEHYRKLQILKSEYVTNVTIEKHNVSGRL